MQKPKHNPTPKRLWKRKKLKTNEHVPKNMLKRISLTVSENQPLKETLMEIARKLEIDLQVDPKIKSSVLFTSHHREFIDVIRQLCRMNELRYEIHGNGISIMVDHPYAKNYNVQFLNMSRNSENRMTISTDVFANVPGKTTSNNVDNGSNSEVKANGTSDFWGELENNLKIILNDNAKYSVHRQAGLISISATKLQHDLVTDYLDALKHVSGQQVLIEAKIIEVSLLDNFRSGINWQRIKNSGLHIQSLMGDAASAARFLDPTTAQSEIISMGGMNQNFSGLLKAMEQFGHQRTLSSPRLTVMNNQSAVLKVAQNQVYFRLNYDKQFNRNSDNYGVMIASDIQTVPIGLVMTVQPSIDQDTGEIILFLRPTISKLAQSVADPAVDIAYNANLSTSGNNVSARPSLIPVVEVKEIDSVLRLHSGEIAVLGGLMEVRSNEESNNLPGLGKIPILKDVFGSNSDGDQVVELVILLKATIEEQPYPNNADHRLINDYVNDPRSL